MERWLDIPIYSFRCEKFPKTVWKREPKTFKGGKNDSCCSSESYYRLRSTK